MSESNSTNGVRAAAYYRMSDDKQENSIDRQKSQVVPYMQKRGYVTVRAYEDQGIAGDVFDRRPAFQQLLKDARAGLFSAIVVDESERLSRQEPVNFIAQIVKPLMDAGVTLDSVAEGPQNWDDLAHLILATVRQDKASGEVKNLSRRVLSECARLAGAGSFLVGAPPYGYLIEYVTEERPGKPPVVRPLGLKPDPRTAHVVTWLFERYARGGVSLTDLAKELNERKSPPPAGKGGTPRKGPPSWTPNAVRSILRNPRYTGALTWNRRTASKYHRLHEGKLERKPRKKEGFSDSVNDRADWKIAPDRHKALVTQDVFERVQSRLKANKGGRGPRLGDYLFSGLVTCSHCGRRLYGAYVQGKALYRCRKYDHKGQEVCGYMVASESVLISAFIKAIQKQFLDRGAREALAAEIARQEAAEKSPNLLDSLRKQIADLEANIAHGNGNLLLPPDRIMGAVTQLRAWETERDRLREDLAARERSQPTQDLAEIVAACESVLWRLREALT
jgi:DNA invertase Pin-like site-specific DNA recombinase